MTDDKALVPIEQRIVEFYEDEITAVLVDENGRLVVYVPIRPLVDALGLAWSGQYERVKRDPVLSDVTMSVRVTRTDIDATSRQPHTSDMLCLPLEFVNGWLFGINASRVKDEIRLRLIRYQRECYQVLAAAFLQQGETAVSPTAAALHQVREMGLAIVRMADELLAIEQRTAATESRLDQAAAFVGQMNKRLTTIERQVSTGKLTEEQASEIRKRVNLIAQEMAKHDPGKSHFQAVYTTLGEEAGVTSYKNIPPKAYEAAAAFLDSWLMSIKQAGGDE